MDGPTFIYQNLERDVQARCKKPGDSALKTSNRCPWEDAPWAWWKIEANMVTSGASRPLKKYHALKLGQAYTLLSGYMIENGGETVAELDPPAIFELILVESLALAGLSTASAAILALFTF